jgi:hypothetical protein
LELQSNESCEEPLIRPFKGLVDLWTLMIDPDSISLELSIMISRDRDADDAQILAHAVNEIIAILQVMEAAKLNAAYVLAFCAEDRCR